MPFTEKSLDSIAFTEKSQIETATIALRPEAPVLADVWTPIGGGVKPGQIDNEPPNTSRYLEAYQPNILDLYSMGNVPSNFISSVQIRVRYLVRCFADPGILCRIRTQIIRQAAPFGFVYNENINLANMTANAYVSLPTRTISDTKNQLNTALCTLSAEQGAGWVLGNGVLRVVEMYIDLWYTRPRISQFSEKTHDADGFSEKTHDADGFTEKSLPGPTSDFTEKELT